MKKLIAGTGLVIALAFTLFFSFEIKKPCLEKPWGEPQQLQYRNLCYNDIQALYGARKLDKSAFPYVVEKSYEYPVLMGLTMWSASLFAHNHVEYFLATIPFLTIAALISLLGLTGAIGFRRHLLWFVASTPLLFYAFLNWDLIPVACVCMAFWGWRRGNLIWTGAALGLGVAAKIYPGFLLPALVVSLWRAPDSPDSSGRVRNVLLLCGSAAASWGAVNLPIMIAEFVKTGDIEGWFAVFAFHGRRTPDFGTFWYWLSHMSSDSLPTFLPLLPPLALGWLTLWTASNTRLRSSRFPVVVAGAVCTVLMAIVMSSDSIRRGPASDDYRVLVDHTSEFVFAAGALALLAIQWFRKRDPWTTGGAILATYLMVSKIHSPQHALWILPMMIVTTVPWTTLAGYLAADAIVFMSGFYWFATSFKMEFNFWTGMFIAGVFLRTIFLAVYVVQCVLTAKDRVPNRFSETQDQERATKHRASERRRAA